MFGWTLSKGTSRTVLLTKRYAIKFPALYSWEFFLRGLIDNMEELKWATYSREYTNTAHLCPTLFGNMFGFYNVMCRVDPVVDVDKFWEDYHDVLDEIKISKMVAVSFMESDAKPNNFGYLNGVLVKVDYAS